MPTGKPAGRRERAAVRLLLLGLNYAPEPVGIGPYTTDMAEWLAARGHEVTVVCGKPYYPAWRIEGPGRPRYQRRIEQGVEIIRCPLYVPARPTGSRRIAHHASFALTAAPVLAWLARRRRPDVVLSVVPSLIATPMASAEARLAGARHWLHVQDFELDAALATGLLPDDGPAIRLAARLERRALAADMVSTISPQMATRLHAKGVPAERIVELRNWASIDPPSEAAATTLRREWGIDRPHVAIYSGAVAHKQGLDLVVEAARRRAHRRDLQFVICGEGPTLGLLKASAVGLDNLLFRDLQPRAQLGDLLGLATLHLLPQIAAAADLVLPSKLANMLASGRPIVTTAAAGTGLADEVGGCGAVVEPGDAHAFARAIEWLIDDDGARAALGAAARARADERWNRDCILGRLEAHLLAGAAPAAHGQGALSPVGGWCPPSAVAAPQLCPGS